MPLHEVELHRDHKADWMRHKAHRGWRMANKNTIKHLHDPARFGVAAAEGGA